MYSLVEKTYSLSLMLPTTAWSKKKFNHTNETHTKQKSKCDWAISLDFGLDSLVENEDAVDSKTFCREFEGILQIGNRAVIVLNNY